MRRLRTHRPRATMDTVITPPPARLNRKKFRDAARAREAYRRKTSQRACVTIVVDEDILDALERWGHLPREAARARRKNRQQIAAAILKLIRDSIAEDERNPHA